MKLLALAAVLMVSGTMVGQAGKAADSPFVFTPYVAPADAPKDAHDYALREFKQYREYLQSKHRLYAGDSFIKELNIMVAGGGSQSVDIDLDGKIGLHGITLEDAFLVDAALKLEDQMRLWKEWDRQEKVREEESQHNPPPSLKAGSGKYKVTPVHQLPADVLANTQCTTKQINVLIEQDAKRTSVMHEMMHVASNCDESVHRAIYELAGPLLKLLQDNPDMTDYLLKRAKPAAPPVAKHEEDCVIDRTYRGKVLCDDGTVIVDHRGDAKDAVLPQPNNAPQLSVTIPALRTGLPLGHIR